MLLLAKYALLLNLFTLAAFGWDKSSARRDRNRIAELNLLQLGFFGGWIGLKLGQRLFNHKKAPHPFNKKLNRAIWINFIGLTIAAVLSQVTTWLPALLTILYGPPPL